MLTGVWTPTALAQEVFWLSEEKCDTLFDIPVPVLPGGSTLSDIVGNGQAQYAGAEGGRVTITITDVKKMPFSGKDFDEAYKNLSSYSPLQDRIAHKVSDHAVLADVTQRFRRYYRLRPGPVEGTYIVHPNNLMFSILAKVRIADWTGYGAADARSQKLWDQHQCTSYHHELGHILVSAQLLEEALGEVLNLPPSPKEELFEKVDGIFNKTYDMIVERQQDYHDALADMGHVLGRSRPYMELPFDWLK